MDFDFSYLDIALIHGCVVTVDPADSLAEAVGVKSNKIVFVGSDKDIASLIDPHTNVIDLKGRTLMPGINDTHFHPILNGMIGTEIDSAIISTGYKNCKSLCEMLGIIEKAVKSKKKGEWISLMGYEPLLFPEKRHPTLEELDKIAPENPVHCMHGGGHICVYNSKALEYLDIHSAADASKYPPGEVEVSGGKLTGMVRGHTHFGLWKQVNYSFTQQEKAAMASHAQLLQAGITSIGDMGECDAPSYHIMQNLCRTGKFKVRTSMALHSIFGKRFSLEDNQNWMNLGLMTGLGDAHFRIGPCKFMIDGGSGGPSCATREPYSHDPALIRERGWEREEVAEYIEKIQNADCQATAHAIGDLAVEFMVEGYEKVFQKEPEKIRLLRNRIEHCTIVDQNLIDRMARMNICPSVNAGMIQFLGANYMKFYGSRNKYVCALRSMIDKGIVCSIHSDAPSGPIGLNTIDSSVNRYDRSQNIQCDKTQAVTVREAIRCATYNGAYATYEEKIKGSIERGKLADMIILSGDILKIDPFDIYTLKVDMTMIDGVIEYERK
ncbi:MAG: amidohydrolase [Treponema sp.]|nr:amidohydrolase [Treponema sp.]